MNPRIHVQLHLTGVALLLCFPMAAAAQLDVQLVQAVVPAYQGATTQVNARIENQTDQTVFLNGISSSLTPDYALEDVYDPFASGHPDSLLPGDGWEGPLLKLTIAPSAPVTPVVFGVSLTGGAHPYDVSELATLYFSVVMNPPPENPVTPGPAPGCISSTQNCATVPVQISRTTGDDIRGFSVEIQLSANLQLCGAGITEGTYLSAVSGTNFQVIDNLGGSYTIDCAILGATCGATSANGVLFDIPVARVASDGLGTITVTSVTLRDCVNGAVGAAPGPPLNITIDTVGPTAVADLAAAQQKTGNDSDGTTKINLSFTPPGDADQVRVYRAPWGGYPEYDDAGFVAPPATPAYPPGSPWALVDSLPGASTSGLDEPATRDFWHYVVFTRDGCGNVSAVSNQTSGTLNYHLGDTHNGGSDCVGNNLVDLSDISFLGGHYGALLAPNDPVNCLDVGPTTDFSVDARPTTDNRVQFEDLLMFAINYGQVGAPRRTRPETAGGGNTLSLKVGAVADGRLDASLEMEAGGTIQGLSVDLAYDPAVVRPVEVVAGELLTRQGTGSAVLSAKPGNVDVALLGSEAALSGSGELAIMRFDVIGPGEAGISVGRVEARDTQNKPVKMGAGGRGEAPDPVLSAGLRPGYPNPFHGSMHLRLALTRASAARLQIFDVTGRLVRTLVDDVLPAGEVEVPWDGNDRNGRAVPSGLYLARLEAGGRVWVSRLLKAE